MVVGVLIRGWSVLPPPAPVLMCLLVVSLRPSPRKITLHRLHPPIDGFQIHAPGPWAAAERATHTRCQRDHAVAEGAKARDREASPSARPRMRDW